MTWGEKYWPLFLIISSLYIAIGLGVPETIALLSSPSKHLDNTLTHYARVELHVSIATANTMHTVAWWATFAVWIVFVVFITAHIWFSQFG